MTADPTTPHGSLHDPRADFFDSIAPQWDHTGQNPQETVVRLGQFTESMQLEPGHQLLEIGCGTGQITQWLAERVRPGRVTAVDFAPRMLEIARAKRIDADFAVYDVCSEPLAMSRFDRILCFHSFPHFRNQTRALANIAAMLKNGGTLIILHLAGSAQINAFHQSLNGCVGHDLLPLPDQWQSLLQSAGLQLLSLEDVADRFILTARHSA